MSSGKHTSLPPICKDTSDKSACCKLPPVEAEYSPKGSYEKINGYKTYVTGPEHSDKAIVAIYDIFGFSPQILQGVSHASLQHTALILGADLLSSTGARVYMPDFLKGEYATGDMFSGTDE
jgi:dienelactone hydrolase